MSDLHIQLSAPQEFRVLRAVRGLSQSEVAAAVRRSQPWLSLVETGKILPQPEQERHLRAILTGGQP